MKKFASTMILSSIAVILGLTLFVSPVFAEIQGSEHDFSSEAWNTLRPNMYCMSYHA
ncbi:MAG: hypothetical protein Q8Q33_03400 [Chlamydiota bacterium]|nr:hypothetical protein [Chlamydiota bacterium]